MIAGWALLVLGVLALAINLYFWALMLPLPGWLARPVRGLVRACGVDGGSCARVVQTPYARLFAGRPNVVAGLPWSLLVIALAFVVLATGAVPALLWWPAFAVALASVLTAVYLVYVLLFRLKDP